MSEELFAALFDESERQPMSVSELNAKVRSVVETEFASVWVEGEIVNFTAAASGHWYFNLNDGKSQLKCVCWKGQNFRIRFKPGNGISVRVRGRISYYEARGETQLVVESLEPSGEGALAAAFQQIKARLDGEGMFAEELKRPIPFLPRRVAVITSKSGAALHDIISVLTRRSRSVSVLLVPTLVQGEGAADSIRAAVEGVNQYNESLSADEKIDVMIVGRGGGSAEDLWAFNDESLARSVRASEIPVISAVGHEIDWTICDLISDLRAATPSAAAELVAGREADILTGLVSYENDLLRITRMQLMDLSAELQFADNRTNTLMVSYLQFVKDRVSALSSRVSPSMLLAKAAAASNALQNLHNRLGLAANRSVDQRSDALKVSMAKLDALSPLAVLTRGFSITQGEDGRIVRDAFAIKKGERLKIRLERGKINAEVLSAEE